jgi:hypothetical protein
MDNSQIDELKNKIIELTIQGISDLKTQNIPFNKFHFEIQKLLREKSVLFNLSARREYPTKLSYKKFGFLDLVWLDGEKLVAAFEIDSRFFITSVWKLLSVNADLRFWIYYRDMTEEELFLFQETNKDEDITLIKIPVPFDITPEKIEEYYNHSVFRNRSELDEKSKNRIHGTTYLITYHLLQKNLTIDEIAKERGFSRRTIVDHIHFLNQSGFDVNIDNFVSNEKQENIKNTQKELNTIKLADIKYVLGDTYSYDEMRLTLSKTIPFTKNRKKEKTV